MEPLKRILLLALLGAGVASAAMALTGNASKWLGSAGLFFDIAALVQLQLSGLFEKIMQIYGDEDEFPYGPPSNITRQIIDDPGRPIRTWARNWLFFDHRTGFYLLATGFVFQLVGLWS